MKHQLYPLKFQPILKEKVWGGQKLKHHFNKVSQSKNLGESWEVSTVPNNVSVVANGYLTGQSLQHLVTTYQSELLGIKNWESFAGSFPLLIKFIDAKEDLSIQLHPNDALAKERHDSFGKTEMWYVMQADEDANLIIGFNKKVDKDLYLKHLAEKTLTKILNFEKVKKGDVFFIESGRLHAIGAGVLLAEIQQTSDVTYRVYDWDRIDLDGNKRELHNDLAIDAMDFNMPNDFRIAYNTQKNASSKVLDCPYFSTNIIELDTEINKTNTYDSFLIYMCVDGRAEIETKDTVTTISKGETVMLPAIIKEFKLKSDYGKLLEVYV